MWCIAIIYALSIFWSPGSLSVILRFLDGLYIPYLAFSHFQCPWAVSFGGMKDPSV